MKTGLFLLFIFSTLSLFPLPLKSEYGEIAFSYAEKIYKKSLDKNKNLNSRELFYASLVYLTLDRETDRVDYLLEIADSMQDRDSQSISYGNFKWYLSETVIKDYNANEFSMQAGLIIWIKFREKLSDKSRTRLLKMIELSTDFSMRRYVRESYTNIALMNIENLILAGEILNNNEVFSEGFNRLKNEIFYIYKYGIHEYASPNYYGVDLDCLGFLSAFTKNSEVRKLAKKLIDLFWLDIIANFHEGSQRLSGTASRTYDYLFNTGYLDKYLYYYGLLKEKAGLNESVIFFSYFDIPPSPEFLTYGSYPRLVRERWGIRRNEARTSYILKDIVLSTSSGTYHTMDVPFSIDIKGERKNPRVYFIPDGRDDPYGMNKIQESAHMKALHLTPFWTAVQNKNEALTLAVYREADIPRDFKSIKSHIVISADFDEAWINDKMLKIIRNEKFEFRLKVNDSLLVKKDRAYYGIKVILAKDFEDGNCPVYFVYDKNKFNAARLTVDHDSSTAGGYAPKASFYVKTGTVDEKDFTSFKKDFIDAKAEMKYKNSGIEIRMKTADSLLEIRVKPPFDTPDYLNPPPANSVLEINGTDRGKELFADIDFLKDYEIRYNNTFELGDKLYIEAEAGEILFPMTVSDDKNASGGKYVWMPGREKSIGFTDIGSISFKLKNKQARKVVIWARILTPTKDDDSFFLNISADDAVLVDNQEWHTGIHAKWEWVKINLKNSGNGSVFDLPEGNVYLQFKAREDGAKIDKVYITADSLKPPSE